MTAQQRAEFASRMAASRAARRQGQPTTAMIIRPSYEQQPFMAAEQAAVLASIQAATKAATKAASKAPTKRGKQSVAKRIGRGYDKLTTKRPWVKKLVKGGATLVGTAIVGEAVAQLADTLVPKVVVGGGFIVAGAVGLLVKSPLVGLPLLGVGMQQVSSSVSTWAQSLKAASIPDTNTPAAQDTEASA
jgi:hypothetical protein